MCAAARPAKKEDERYKLLPLDAPDRLIKGLHNEVD